MIREREVEFDENNKLVIQQKSCMTCTKREFCKDILAHIQNIYFENDYEKMLLLLRRVCENYQSIYIKYPIEVNEINSENGTLLFQTGKLVLVNIYKDGIDEKLHLGILLGSLPTSIVTTYNKETKIINNKFMTLPILYIFTLNKCIFGTQAKWQDLYDAGINILSDEEKNIINNFQSLQENIALSDKLPI